ncbi:MAG: bile acid:sodium symporter family protein [Bacteroidota bacterium]
MIPESIDTANVQFSPDSLFALNIILGFIMFGVALELSIEDFRRVLRKPKAPLIGLVSQFFVLPFLTFLAVWILPVTPSMALGMFLVAACPGGNISNFISSLAKANVALSVSLTAFSTLLAMFLTPINFSFWASLYPPSAEILQTINLDEWELVKTVFLLLGAPLILGMWTAYKFPKFTRKISRPIRIFSILFFVAFVMIALYNNFAVFQEFIQSIILLVLIHNALALGGGYLMARLGGLPRADRKSITIETGIQNSGLGLIIIFNFFNGLGGMAVITAWWGIWHIIAGLSLAFLWSDRRILAPS